MTFRNAERHRFFVIPFYAEPDRLDKKLFLRPVLFEECQNEALYQYQLLQIFSIYWKLSPFGSFRLQPFSSGDRRTSLSCRCGKNCKEQCEKPIDNVESCGRDTGTKCKGKRAKAKICPCSLALKKFQVSVEVSNMRQPSIRSEFSRIKVWAVSCPHELSYFSIR